MTKKKKKNQKPWWKDKVLWGNIIFLVVPLATATISAFHVFTFIGIGNSVNLAVATAVVYEIFVIAGMYSIVTKSKASPILIWLSFIVIAIIQIIGNTYHAFNYISDMSIEKSEYLNNFIDFSRMVFGIDDDDVVRSRYVAALIIGTPVPVISFMITKAAASIFSDNKKETISIWSNITTFISTWISSATGKLEVKSVEKYISSIQKDLDDMIKSTTTDRDTAENNHNTNKRSIDDISKSLLDANSETKKYRDDVAMVVKKLESDIKSNKEKIVYEISRVSKLVNDNDKSMKKAVDELGALLTELKSMVDDIKSDIEELNAGEGMDEVINKEDNASSLLS